MSEKESSYEKPEGSRSAGSVATPEGEISYAAAADWMVLRENEKPVAEIFHVAYLADAPGAERPLTVVFNGGPGAASAYLHMGALGPQRVLFGDYGVPGAPPVTLTENAESWLGFTDLVFVDPVGTGFSRGVADPEADKKQDPGKEFWKLERDLASLGEFISRFLSLYKRWDSPIFLAGESYGGFRAAKLARLLQERYGVGLNGVTLISPALEFALLDTSDYDLLPWIDVLPSMVAAAVHHGKATATTGGGSVADLLKSAEEFATSIAPPLLLRGEMLSESGQSDAVGAFSKFLGLPANLIENHAGRIAPSLFARELLRDDGLVLGLYDATITTADPFPASESFRGPDPTLRAIERLFAAGINTHLRRDLGISTEREYRLLSMEVNEGWEVDTKRHALQSQLGATDDLRYAMSLNPHMRVRISHGIYDLVTPYFSSNRIAAHMRLKESQNALSIRHYRGGHMFYTWKESRESFSSDMRAFYRAAQG